MVVAIRLVLLVEIAVVVFVLKFVAGKDEDEE